MQAYHQSASTLNLLRAFTKGGFADLSRVAAWNQEFVATSREGQRYEAIASEIERALRFMAACGIDLARSPQLHEVDFYTSHEALILGYEEALTRTDSLTGDWYDCSAHMLWIGDRTRQLDGAHVEFLRGVGNPIGCKIGPTASVGRGARVLRRAQSRTGAGAAHAHRSHGRRPRRRGTSAAAARGHRRRPPGGLGVRPDARQHVHELLGTQDPPLRRRARRARAGSSGPTPPKGTWPGGVHVELTGDDVTECLGGAEEILDHQLDDRYETMCDPRLNARQSLDLAYRIAELLRR